MERFWCYAMGFFVALFLVIVFILVKDEVEERKEAYERRMKFKMQNVFHEELEKVRPFEIRGLDEYIDHKLAEKEGEHETAEL